MINQNRKLDKTRVSLQDVEDIKNEIKLEALIKKGTGRIKNGRGENYKCHIDIYPAR